MTVAAQARKALLAGRKAAQDKQPPANPYNGNAAEARERVLAKAWRLGYSNANPMPVDYSS